MGLPDGYHFIDMQPALVEPLWRVGKSADTLFAPWFPSLVDAHEPLDEFSALLDGKSVWVIADDAGGAPVGFAVASDVDGIFWLHQMSVHADHARNGLGSALLSAVIDRAKWAFYNAVALSTFRDVPFNQPFYEKAGFLKADIAAAPQRIQNRFAAEIPAGVHPTSRIFMVRKL